MVGVLEKNLKTIQSNIKKEKGSESPSILAVSKKQPIEKVTELFRLGLRDFGENYLQEAKEKMEILKDHPIRWHYIGNIQSKKIRDLVGNFYLIQTVSRISEVQKMAEVASEKGVTQNILVQVNIADEATKQGVIQAELPSLISEIDRHPNLGLKGFMFFPPQSEIEKEVLTWFSRSSALFENYKSQRDDQFSVLSMGTSHDYPLAVRQGATLVRLGECLMGPRP